MSHARAYARAFSYQRQAHATVANKDFKAFENNLKASERQKSKWLIICLTDEQNKYKRINEDWTL